MPEEAKQGQDGGVLARTINVESHRWGKENLQTMTYVRVGKKAAGRLLDGREWNERPEVLNG